MRKMRGAGIKDKQSLNKSSSAKTAQKNEKKITGKKTKKEKIELVDSSIARSMMEELMRLYPDADCELVYDSIFQLLIAVILSAQTTDVQVNKCTGKLFARFPDARALAEAPIEEIKELIRATGYFNAKANNIQRCAQELVTRFGGEVPRTKEELMLLPGVGGKTANVVLGVAFGVPGWTVDTHVQRLSKRLGLSSGKDPVSIERDLEKLFPKGDWSKMSITLIWHGRRLCFARKPQCDQCPINHLCPDSTV